MGGIRQRDSVWLKLFGLKDEPHPVAGAPTPDACVTPDPARCVQCGVCGYNCPVGIPVRDFARQGKVVDDARCVQCGQCIEVCPRGTLRWASPSVDKGWSEADEALLAEMTRRSFESPAQSEEAKA
jgi:ferredoxin